MSTATDSKTQRVKKWVLLIASLIAAVIWVRNLMIILPQVASSPVAHETTARPTTGITPSAIAPGAFHDSSGWHDPFAASFLSRKRSSRPVAKSTGSAKPVPKAEVQLPSWRLTGVVWSEESPAAVLVSDNGARQVVVSRGDSLGTTYVEKISDSLIWLRMGKQRWKLGLEETTVATAP
jgi:type II secretory pathway component PulC